MYKILSDSISVFFVIVTIITILGIYNCVKSFKVGNKYEMGLNIFFTLFYIFLLFFAWGFDSTIKSISKDVEYAKVNGVIVDSITDPHTYIFIKDINGYDHKVEIGDISKDVSCKTLFTVFAKRGVAIKTFDTTDVSQIKIGDIIKYN